MGPGCFHPRNLALQVESTELLSLQWGRDVSIPEIRKRREPSARYQPLQWGRDVSIPEIPSGLPRGMVQRRASMGPGCFHPRNAAPVGSTHTSPWLQWGRDVSIPEMPYSFPAYTESTSLQWGRDVSIPEMGWSRARRGRGPGFNGAGMFPSQKCDCHDVCCGVYPKLQWGRDVSIPEIATPLLYSIFKDLRALPRAPLHFKPTIHSRTILSAANPRRSKPLPIRERSPLNPPRPVARTRLPRRKHVYSAISPS